MKIHIKQRRKGEPPHDSSSAKTSQYWGIPLLQYLMTIASVGDTLLTWRPRSCLQASHFPQLDGKVTPSWVSSPGLPSGNHTRCLWPTKKQETITGGVAHSLFSSTILSQGERNKSWQWGYLHPVIWGDSVTPNCCCYLPFQKLQTTNSNQWMSS